MRFEFEESMLVEGKYLTNELFFWRVPSYLPISFVSKDIFLR